MYPNATVRGGGGADDWKSRLPQGFDQSKIPAGANGVTKDGEVYIFTKDGTALPNGKYNADGSVFSGGGGNSSTSTTGTSGNTGTSSGYGQVQTGVVGPVNFGAGGSLFGNGFANNGIGGYGDLSSSLFTAGFDIDPNILMQSANMAGNVPFGLGGFFAQGPLQSVMQSFMNSVSFKFDFSNYNFAASPATSTTGNGNVPAGYTATEVAGVYLKDGKYYKYDANNNLVECNANGSAKTTQGRPATTRKVVPSGYTETDVDNVFKKGDKYYKYDTNNNLVECKADGSALPAEKPSPAPNLASYDQFMEQNLKAGLKLKSVLNKDGSHTVTDMKNKYVYNFNTNGQLVSKIEGKKVTEHTYADGNSFRPIKSVVTNNDENITTTKYEKTTQARVKKDKFIEDLNKSGVTNIEYNGNDITYNEGSRLITVKFADDGSIISKTSKLATDTHGDYTTTVSYEHDGYVVTTEGTLTDKGKKKRSDEKINENYWNSYSNLAFK